MEWRYRQRNSTRENQIRWHDDVQEQEDVQWMRITTNQEKWKQHGEGYEMEYMTLVIMIKICNIITYTKKSHPIISTSK